MHNASAPTAKKSLMPISRIVVIVFVVVATLIIVWELRVRSQWNATYNAIASQIEKEETLSKKELDKYLKGSPNREQPDKNQELFIWSGILQKYRIRLYYSGEMVTRIESQ